MSPLSIAPLTAVGLGLIVVGAVRARRPAVSDATEFLRHLDDAAVDEFDATLRLPFSQRVIIPVGAKLLGMLGRFTPVARRAKVHHQLVQAGLETRMRAEEFVAGQMVLTGFGIALSLIELFLGHGAKGLTTVAVVLLPVVGFLAPNVWLSRKATERKERLFLDMPDVLDLLAISVEAGTGFEGALQVVCANVKSDLATEFSRALKEMELGLPRKDALKNLKKRADLPELSNFVLALIQADELGMPLSRVLHTQAAEMRLKRRQWARERAAKLPVKVLFPLVAFIFPAMLIVVLGPAASSIMKSLR